MGATEKIARFIVDTGYEDIPRDVGGEGQAHGPGLSGSRPGRRCRAGQPGHSAGT